MKKPEWLKSKARKEREATERKALLEQQEAERKRQEEVLKRKWEEELAAANTPEKLEESGAAMLINLIRNYKGIYVYNKNRGHRNAEVKWLMGNIVLDAINFRVSYREGLSETFLFYVPCLQEAAVRGAMQERLTQIKSNPMPLEKMRPVKAELEKVYRDIEQRKEGLTDQKAINKLDDEYRRYGRDVFVRLACEALENIK